MLTRLLSLLLILLTSFSINAEDPDTRDWTLITFDPECEEAKCIEENISNYKLLTDVGKRHDCFPPEASTQEQIEEYYSTTMLNENCVRILAKLKEANDWWENAEATIKSHLEEQSVNCNPEDRTPGSGVVTEDMVGVLSEDEGNAPTCTEERKKEVKEKNKDELMCIAKATFSFSAFSTIADYVTGGIGDDKNSSGDECSDYGDNCLYQLASGFGNALWALWEGGKFLAQAAWSGIKNVAVNTWDSIWGNEEKTSNTGLALAEASEDDGVLSALLEDPLGSMKKMWDGLMGMLGHWLSDDVFCQKWSGVPHQSECTEPFTSFACMSYGSMIKGGCHIVGWAIAEIVPAFLTGGIVSAVKWGAKAGKALAKAIPVSSAVRTALKN
ncbi:MAG: hypothetical protein NXH75_11470, partial [Halobacteriovoraceae bacterium]|nr:hypothetical protein [Halobacteriovoraceae bacterium]